jgi:hypothetical protein
VIELPEARLENPEDEAEEDPNPPVEFEVVEEVEEAEENS